MKKLTPAQFKKIYATVPRLTVEVLVQNEKGTLLTYREIDPVGIWHLPGGTVLFGEPLVDAVERVAREELGVEAKALDMVGIVDVPDYKDGKEHAVAVVFAVKLLSDDIKLDFQASKYEYFTKAPKNTLEMHAPFVK